MPEGTWRPATPLYPPGSFTWSGDTGHKPLPVWEPRAAEPLSAEEMTDRLQERHDRERLAEAQDRLRLAVTAAADPVPCLGPGPDGWLSEDRAERRAAAARCWSCPVIVECGQLADALQLQVWGVFAGRDYTDDDDPAAMAAQLRALQGAAVTIQTRSTPQGVVVRARRDELLVKLKRHRWTVPQLADLSGLSRSYVSHIVYPGHKRWRQDPERARAGKVERRTKHEAEVAALKDPRVARLRELGPLIDAHPSPVVCAGTVAAAGGDADGRRPVLHAGTARRGGRTAWIRGPFRICSPEQPRTVDASEGTAN